MSLRFLIWTFYRALIIGMFLLRPVAMAAASNGLEYVPLRAGGTENVAWFVVDGKRTAAIAIRPMWDAFGDDGRVLSYAGNAEFEITRCDGAATQRAVNVHFKNSSYQDSDTLDALARRAAIFVWQNCPKPRAKLIDGMNFDLNMGSVKFVLEDGTVAAEASKFNCYHDGANFERLRYQSLTCRWMSFVDVITTTRETQRSLDKANEQRRNGYLYLAAFGLLLFFNRDSIIRFYYLNFHPHPAAAMVDALIAQGGDTSNIAREVAEILDEVPPDSRILRAVRLQQTEQLVNDIRAANVARERAFERQARSDAIASYEREAFYCSQQAMALAVEALERSKIAYATATNLRRGKS